MSQDYNQVFIGQAVTIDFEDLLNGSDLSKEIEEAYGVDGLGLLTVKNVPGLVDARQSLLPLSLKFATLPDAIKAKYIHEKSTYSFGWSHGKEKLQGAADLSKGSYYANPQYDRPVDDENLIAQYSEFVHPNIWPHDDMPELESAFKTLGQLIVSVGTIIARHCDRYVKSKCVAYADNKLSSIIEKSLCCKGRLLHYFPRSEDISDTLSTDIEFSSWCGWHNDHGSLTGLTSAMFLDTDGKEVANVDGKAGLYIRNRKSQLVKIGIPRDHIAFQIGETAQIHSGGFLQATPHAVRGSSMAGVSRETFAVFMEPNWDEPMTFPVGLDVEAVQSQSSAANLPSGVPPLRLRWKPSQSFGEFTSATLQSYY